MHKLDIETNTSLTLLGLFTCLILLVSGFVVAETHELVQSALDYELPENTCTKPRIVTSNKSVSGSPLSSSGSFDIFEGEGASEVSDMDSYTRRRLEKKAQRWRKCVAEYKEDLLNDMEELKSSAQYGLTQDQASTILGNMAGIQQVYMTEEGVLAETDSGETPDS